MAHASDFGVDTRFGTVRCLASAGADTSLPTALLVHGVGARADTWLPLFAHLRGVRAIAIDLPGHGGSGGSLPATIESCAACLDDVRIAIGLQAAFAVGQSLGGAVVQRYALDHAAACRGIVIAHSASHFTIAGERIEQVIGDWPTAMEAFAVRQVSRGASDDLKARARRLVAARDPAVLAHDLRLCNAFDARPWAPSVRTPVLVLAGDEDAGYGPDQAADLQSLYAGSRLVLLSPCGHNGVLERPAEFAAAVESFVREA